MENVTFNLDLCPYEAKIDGNVLEIENFLYDVPDDEELSYFYYGKIEFDENTIRIERNDAEIEWCEIIGFISKYYESIGFEFLMTHRRYYKD